MSEKERAMSDVLKDERLARVAEKHNVAIFASFGPGESPALRFEVTREPLPAATLEDQIDSLMRQSVGSSLNVRSFREGESKGSPFLFGLTSTAEVVRQVRTLAAQGYYTIVNETIDVHDGGISGAVRLGDVVEMAPGATPRGVEGADAATMPLELARSILHAIHGHIIEIPGSPTQRVEFSTHPIRVGHRHEHVLVWEVEEVGQIEVGTPELVWPNALSRHVGDKVFGLLVAQSLGAAVPHTMVFGRTAAPFAFGRRTGTGETWIRTVPFEPVPGQFTTRRGWVDPFALLSAEDPEGVIAAVVAQEGVDAEFSGATAPLGNDDDLVEGVAGYGDSFMLGDSAPTTLPTEVVQAVKSTTASLRAALGPVRIEWVYSRGQVWVVQMHRVTATTTAILNAGEASEWVEFRVSDGLEALRALLADLPSGYGVRVVGRVGVTSHVGDLLRKAGVPARMEWGGSDE